VAAFDCATENIGLPINRITTARRALAVKVRLLFKNASTSSH